jgi:hypothetical protein
MVSMPWNIEIEQIKLILIQSIPSFKKTIRSPRADFM